jgi:hypothetical protein
MRISGYEVWKETEKTAMNIVTPTYKRRGKETKEKMKLSS